MFPLHPADTRPSAADLEHVIETDVPVPTVTTIREPIISNVRRGEAALGTLLQYGGAQAETEVHRGTIEERRAERVRCTTTEHVGNGVLVHERRALHRLGIGILNAIGTVIVITETAADGVRRMILGALSVRLADPDVVRA